MAEEFRDPARRRLLNITDEAQAEKGELQTQLPDVSVPSQFDTPIQSTGIRADVLAGVQGNFDRNIAQIQENALENRRFRAGSTSNAELNEARSSRNIAIGELGKVELQSQGQLLGALGGVAQVEAGGEQARATQEELLTFEQQKVDIMAGGLALDEGRLTLDNDKLLESARQFDLSSEDQRAQFTETIRATAEQNGLDRDQTAALAAASLKEGARQFDRSDETQRKLADETLAEGARQFGLSQDMTRELAENSLSEDARQFDLSQENDMDKFSQHIAEQARQFGLDQEQTATLAANALTEGARQFDFSQGQALDIHMDNIAEMQRQFDLSDDQVRDLAGDALIENGRQFDINSSTDMQQFAQNLSETSRQFNMGHAQTAQLAAMTIASQEGIAREGLKIQHIANMLDFMIEGAEALTQADGIAILDMAFEQSDIEERVGITPAASDEVTRVISEVNNAGTQGPALHAALNDPSVWSGGTDHPPEIMEQIDFNRDGIVDNSDYIIYVAGGGQFGNEPG